MSKRKKIWVLCNDLFSGEFSVYKDTRTPLYKLRKLEKFVGAYRKPADALEAVEISTKYSIRMKRRSLSRLGRKIKALGVSG